MSAGTAPILALIPGYQEGPRIATVVAAAARHLPVVVIDDGSTDDTAAQAEAAGATVLRQVPNAGKGAALRAGFRHALDAGAEAVVTLDADGQHDPDEIPRLPGRLRARPPGARHRAARLRLDAAGPAPVEHARAAGPSRRRSVAAIPDNQSGYRLIGRRLMRALLDRDESGFEFEVEMIARCIALGLPIAWVPIRTIYAGEPSHIRPLAPPHASSCGSRARRGGSSGAAR